ncbi:MAG: sugar kinase [Pseudomonadota bacterium]
MSDPFVSLTGGGRPARIACLGEPMLELSDLRASDGRVALGVAGDSLNCAVYLRRMSPASTVSVDYLTALGTDNLSDRMVGFMRGQGLGTDGIARISSRLPGLYAIEVDDRGERSFRYWRSASAARSMLGPEGLDLDRLAQLDVLYLSGISLAILPHDGRARLIEACAALKDTGKAVVFDSNYRPILWDSIEDARTTMSAMWAATTLGLPSRDDEEAIWGDASAHAIIDRLVSLGVPEIALKDGSNGPHLAVGGERYERGAYRRASAVVDTTSAGDAFNGGYLAARLAGLDPNAAAKGAHELAIAVIGHSGAIIPQAAMPPAFGSR